MRLALFTALLCGLIAAGSANITPEVKIRVFSPPADMVRGRNIMVHLQEDFIIQCEVDNMPIHSKVTWEFVPASNPTIAIIKSIDYDSKEKNKVKIAKGQSLNSYRLMIISPEISDEGKYICKVQYDSNADAIEEPVNVEIVQAPVILTTQSSSDRVSKEGDNVEFVCTAQGRPEPKIIWTRAGNVPFPDGGFDRKSKRVTLENIKPDARGDYVCTASNKIDRHVTMKINLDIIFSPRISAKSQVLQALDYKTDLTCTIEANPQPTEELVTWSKQGKILNEETDNRFSVVFNRMSNDKVITSLTINGVREQDYGTYICSATNPKGDSNSHQIELRKTDTPMPYKTGQVLTAGNQNRMSVFSVLLCSVAALLLYRQYL